MRIPLAFAAICLLAASGRAQPAVGWEAYPAYTEVTAVASSPDGLWAASDGGVFFYDVATGELRTATVADGLEGGPVGALATDPARGVLWIGYQDGVLERLDTETLEARPFFEITRADQYPARGVRRIVVAGDVLYVATDFGVVVFDAATERVQSAYARFGDLEAGTGVNDVLEAPLPDGAPGLWVATDGGLYTARRDGATLQAPGAWTRESGFSGAALSLVEYGGTVFVGGGPDGARDLYRRKPDGSYDRRLFTNNPITSLAVSDGRLYAVSPPFAYSLASPDAPRSFYRAAGATALSGLAIGPGGEPWVGDAAIGLFRIPRVPELGENNIEPAPVAPPGPLSTNIVDIDVDHEGVVWAVTERLEAAGFASVNRLEDGAWTAFRTDDPSIDIARASLESASVGPDGAFYAGSAGDGVTVFRDGEVTRYSEDNSSLLSATGTTGFIVVRDVAFEDDAAWVLNFSARPLHRFDGATWQGFPYPSGIPSSAQAFRIAIDELGQKWLALGSNGLGVWDTGDDPLSAADDRATRFAGAGSNGTGLPDAEVRDVVVAPDGRVWVGTERGIASVFRPLDAFSADPSLAAPQWPILADGSDFLLRDVEVNDLEVDPAGQIWVATSSGAYLVDAAGTGLVRTVTAARARSRATPCSPSPWPRARAASTSSRPRACSARRATPRSPGRAPTPSRRRRRRTGPPTTRRASW
ncbi:two-component regulator propeller domain-containing protein [Rubrivirga sp.]|uniref:two-component regulator propeller domain-containing protein n=1 Tax=Rubrivirga sp. TaxID=1885344 RepID=UPI003B52BBC4